MICRDGIRVRFLIDSGGSRSGLSIALGISRNASWIVSWNLDQCAVATTQTEDKSENEGEDFEREVNNDDEDEDGEEDDEEEDEDKVEF